MTYRDTIDYLFTRLPMFSRIGAAAIKKDLTNTIALCDALGNPQQHFPCIHVAGTNGKGSVSHMLAAVLQNAGYRTGLYTSPHLHDFRERIKVDGEMISEEAVVAFTQQIQPHIDQLEPSFFEITVAMAFHYFAQQQVHIAVIETGLGGRLDSTNVVQPLLSVITNIGMDHMNLLGNTLEAIASEKAGIIKAATPVVVGAVTPETQPVFEQTAKRRQAPLLLAGNSYQVQTIEAGVEQLKITVMHTATAAVETYTLDLPGAYQVQNLLTVLTAVDQLREQGYQLPPATVQQALCRTRTLNGLQGRWQVIHRSPLVVLDVAHNADGMQLVVQQLGMMSYRRLHVVMGMVRDKDVEEVLTLLPQTASYYFTQAHIPRALPAVQLQQLAATRNLAGAVFDDVNTALDQAMQAAQADDLILVCGSVFLVGEVDLARWTNLPGTETA